jgi:hypothetical protein
MGGIATGNCLKLLEDIDAGGLVSDEQHEVGGISLLLRFGHCIFIRVGPNLAR